MSRTILPVAAFGVTAAMLALYGIEGGAYDVVVRQWLAVGVWLALAGGWASGVLPRVRLGATAGWALTALALLGVLTAIGLTWTDSAQRTVAEMARIAHLLGVVLLVASIADRNSAAPIVWGCLAAAALVCAIALGSRLLPSVLPSEGSSGVFSTTRLSYPLDYYNAIGTWGCLTVALGLVLSAHATRPALRALALAVVPLAGLVVFLSYSRAGVVGGALAVTAAVFLGRNRWTTLVHAVAAAATAAAAIAVTRDHRAIADGAGTEGAAVVATVVVTAMLVCAAVAGTSQRLDEVRMTRRRGRRIVAVTATAGVLAGLVAGAGYANSAWREFTEPPGATPRDPIERLAGLGSNRDEIWSSALHAFAEHPLGGLGSGTFEFWFNRDGGATSVKDAHSLFLESLAELGVLGLLAVLILLVALAAGAWNALRRAPTAAAAGPAVAGVCVLVVFAFHAGVDWIWECTAVTVLVLVATTAAGALGKERRSALAVPWRLAGVLLAVAMIALQLPGLSSEQLLRDSRAAAAERHLPRALELADQAVGAQPWAAAPFVQRALVLERLGRPREARGAMDAAVSREPTNWRHPLIRARIEATLGDAGAALADLRRARRLRPGSRFLPRDGGP